MKDLKVESKKFLCNDCPTRWSTTYELLKIAVDLEKVFEKFEAKDPTFARDVVTLEEEDFRVCRAMVGFLEKFKLEAEKPLGSSQPRASQDVVHIDDENDFMGDFLVEAENPSGPTDSELTEY
ncbi:hypothetical protein L1887_29614 [Cichorium endivia]|nr:hypothetical protein L1887_29614 [Cichorium endivia]